MELAESIRILWRRRLLLAIAIVVAVAAGMFVSFKVTPGFPPHLQSRSYDIGQANAIVLIDTHSSQISNLNPAGAVDAYSRASLLADLMATQPLVQRIAHAMRIPAGQLLVTPPIGSIVPPLKATSLAVAANKASRLAARFRIAVTIDPNLPLISLAATAPTPPQAAQLASQAISAMQHEVQSTASTEPIPPADQVVVNTVSQPVGGPLVQGTRKLYGVVVTMLLFLVSCFVLVLTSRERKRFRAEALIEASPSRLDQTIQPGWASYVPTRDTDRTARARFPTGTATSQPPTVVGDGAEVGAPALRLSAHEGADASDSIAAQQSDPGDLDPREDPSEANDAAAARQIRLKRSGITWAASEAARRDMRSASG